MALSLCVGGLLAGCVNTAPLNKQRDALAAAPEASTPVTLTSVPFFAQAQYQCGPAALATLLQAQGVDVKPEALVDEVYLPDKQGSLQTLMVAAARQRGQLTYVRENEGLAPLLKEIYAGKPVLVMQNLGLPRIPNWHYAVVVGWLPETETVILRSGVKAEQKRSLSFFEYTWRASNYWALSLYSPDAIPVAPTLETWLQAAIDLESIGQIDAAQQAYQQLTKYYPKSFMAWMGLGNAAYQLQHYTQAEIAYRHALTLTQQPAAPAHNLAWALIQQKKYHEALSYAQQARDAGLEDYSSAWQWLTDELPEVPRS